MAMKSSVKKRGGQAQYVKKKGPRIVEQEEDSSPKTSPKTAKRPAKDYKQGQEFDDPEVRSALGDGSLSRVESGRRRRRDLRTLYMRFNHVSQLPKDPESISKLHKDIKEVRVARQDRDKSIHYCFVQFEDEEQCRKAKEELNHRVYKDGTIYVDNVNANPTKEKDEEEPMTKEESGKRSLRNMKRLFVSGGGSKMKVSEVKEVFNKAVFVHVPSKSVKKGKAYAFVHFENEKDAKEAFDQMQRPQPNGMQWTVLYAKIDRRTLNKQKKEENDDDLEQEQDSKTDRKRKGNEDHQEVQSKRKKGKKVKAEEKEQSKDEEEGDKEVQSKRKKRKKGKKVKAEEKEQSKDEEEEDKEKESLQDEEGEDDNEEEHFENDSDDDEDEDE